jgi:hypothetical protein
MSMCTKRLLCAVLLFQVGCSLLREQQQEPDDDLTRLARQSLEGKPLSPEKTEELVSTAGESWLYGQGVGESAVTVGAIVAFPPYALWVLGNAALSLSGYEPIQVSDALPERERDAYRSVYDQITSAPGHATAAIAGTEFRTKERIRKDYERVLLDAEPQDNQRNKDLRGQSVR